MKNDSITILKAFGILFMVLAHAGCPKLLHDFIYMFHMPLFFIASGYCFKEKYLQDNKTFIIRRIKGLYVPFVKWSLIFLALHNVFFYLNIYNGFYGFHGTVSSLYTWKDFLIAAKDIITRMMNNPQLLGGYWFLREMLWGTIISLFVLKYLRSPVWSMILMLILSIACKILNLHVPYWGLGSLTFLSASFFIAGYMFRKLLIASNINISWGGVNVICLITVAIGSLLMPSNMLNYTTWQIIPYSICAIAGTWLFFNISKAIANTTSHWKKFMVFVGDNTMTILTWHFLCFKLVSLLIIGVYGLPIERLAEFPVIEEFSSWWIVYFIVGVGIPMLGVFFYNRIRSE